MNNTTEIINPNRRKFLAASAIFVVMVVIFSIVVAIISMVLTKNLNGEVEKVTVTVKEVNINDDGAKLIAENGVEYWISSLSDKLEWESFVGKTIVLVIPQEQFSGDSWILGVIDGESALIDFRETIAERKNENIIVVSVFSGIVFVSLVISIVCGVIANKKPKTTLQSIDESVWQVFGSNLPKSPSRQKFGVISLVFFVLFIALAGFLAFSESIESKAYVIASVVLFFTVLISFCVYASIGTFYYLPKDEIKFYKKNYPFDSDDVSHLPIRKALKNRLSEQLKNSRLANPDLFDDLGNGLDARFTESGLFLSYPEEETDFDATGVFDEFDSPNEGNFEFQYTIPYEKLNFVAIPKYRKYVNMFGVIVKSRLDGNEEYPNEIRFDIHFLLDKNLLNSLRKFGVEVEGLDGILNNIEKLMKENCKKAKSGFQKNMFF